MKSLDQGFEQLEHKQDTQTEPNKPFPTDVFAADKITKITILVHRNCQRLHSWSVTWRYKWLSVF